MKANKLVEKLYEAKVSGMTDNGLDDLIFDYLSANEKIVPALIAILGHERDKNRALLLDTNLELSMALVTLDSFSSDQEQRTSTIQRIKAHYHKVSDRIKCCFRVNGIPD